MKKRYSLLCALTGLLFSFVVQATVVEVRTNLGNFQVNLFDERTPRTVENFLGYVNSGAYANNVMHRSVDNFIVQMGGFQFSNDFPPDAVATGPAVINEPVLSNVRGTLAMAKLGGNPNSATSQFFINLSNNASNLDAQNGGFTVFGQVIGNGMTVVDQIAAIDQFNFSNLSSALVEIPLQNYTNTDFANGTLPVENNLVIITDIVVIDPATVTNPNLNPSPNTLINSGGQTPDSGGSSGGGSVGFMLIAGLFFVSLRRCIKLIRN